MLEKTLEYQAYRLAKENGCILLKLKGLVGIPDRLLIKDGKTIFIEFKRNNKCRMSKPQYRMYNRLLSLNQEVFLISDLSQFKNLLYN